MTRTNRILRELPLFMFIGCLLIIADAQIADRLTQNPCINKETCKECIQTRSCSWCTMKNYTDKPRCFLPDSSSLDICPKDHTVNVISKGKVIENRMSTKAHSAGNTKESIVQLSPQKVNLKLRINEPFKLDFNYLQAEDYPVDLYYLMDLSNSMKDDKTKLSSLGNLLSETMKNITSNFRLGFGSFVDKVLMPYVSTHPEKMKSPCSECASPYGYRNHMSLNADTEKFSKEVRDAAISGNMDTPEGGFDAIMQAIVCRQSIGWRDQARRLLIFSTDAAFHYAGDGKLGGIIEPNDGECHLDDSGVYTYSKIQDYPSISQINHYVKKNSINIIFAVTQSESNVYTKLSGRIEGSSSAVLSDDSSNVVELVKDEYNKISSSIEMKDNANSYVKIKYFSSCKNKNSRPFPTNKCDGLKVGDKVSFSAEITVTECPSDPKQWHQTIQIYPVGINETLTVDLEMLCSCPCEDPTHFTYKTNSKDCSSQGDYVCGICACKNSTGRHCECTKTNENSNSDSSSCRAEREKDVECSGRGQCECGICKCEKRPNPEEMYSGKFCECDNFSCDRHNQLLCSGPDQGKCNCGVCDCEPGWTGSACDCLASNDTCKLNGEGEVCSGHGECECGVCKCMMKSENEGRYSGRYCEDCLTCYKHCLDLKDCVQCHKWKTGPLKDVCAENCTINFREDTNITDEDPNRIPCSFYDENDCRFKFKYTEIDGELVVYAQDKLECPPKVFVLPIVLGVIATIVLLGVASLLLWKLVTTIHDRREFARFEKERGKANWGSGANPIYKEATAEYANPMFEEM